MTTQDSSSIPPLPHEVASYWLDSVPIPTFGKLTSNLDIDTVVIGAGITGITTAYLLAKAGVQTALVSERTLINGTTGHTTAKVTAQHNLTYAEYIQHFGEQKARLFYEANAEALGFIRQTVAELGIDCDLQDEDAYVYAVTKKGAQDIEKEGQAYRKLGIPGKVVQETPLPFQVENAIVMPHQARFHPIPYLNRLLQEFVKLGGQVYEDTMVSTVEEGETATVNTTDEYKITCRHVVSCSNFPIFETGLYYSRVHPVSSYIIAVESDQELPHGMFISGDEPARSVRAVTYNGDKLLLIGGESHKTGKEDDAMSHYEALQAFAANHFGAVKIRYRWSTQDLSTLDNLPYIGRSTTKNPNSFVATGFRRWGMTTGTAAALILRDLITGADNPYEELFNPSRSELKPTNVKTFLKQNTDVGIEFIKGKLKGGEKEADSLQPNEGGYVTYEGKQVGGYRDEAGKLYLVDTTCTHMRCEVRWNNGDRTWDCPCHGARFAYDGQVIKGPAVEPLASVEQQEEK